MEEKKKRGRPKKSESNPKEKKTKKSENQSLLKTVKKEKKPKKVKTEVVSKKTKSITKGLKKKTISLECISLPGIFRSVEIWNKFTPLEDISNGDEVITACGYHGFVIEKHNNHVSIKDIKGYGYRTVIKEAIFKISEGKNNPDYMHEMKLRKLSKQRGNVATIEDDINFEENEDE